VTDRIASLVMMAPVTRVRVLGGVLLSNPIARVKETGAAGANGSDSTKLLHVTIIGVIYELIAKKQV
jgi:hypothetical protein